MNKDINYWIARCASLEQELDMMKEQSTIKWRTGEPRQDGLYIVTSFDFVHKVDICRILERVGYRWINWSIEVRDCNIKAWCKLSDIKPCKGNDYEDLDSERF